MTAKKFREMLILHPFRPLLVKATDGDTFRVDRRDYALVSPKASEVVIFDKDDHLRIVAMNHIVSIEPVRVHSRKAGRR